MSTTNAAEAATKAAPWPLSGMTPRLSEPNASSVRKATSTADSVPATSPIQPAVRRHPLPEHTEDERREQRGVEEPEQGLEVVHDVGEVELASSAVKIAMTVAADRRDPADPQVVVVGCGPCGCSAATGRS